MKRVFILSLSVMFALTLSAFAGEYHQGAELTCYQCHTMHYSQTHLYGDQHEVPIYFGPDGPYDYLLRGPINDLCLSCHDNQDIIDVYQESDVYTVQNRQGGYLNKVGDTNENGGHTLGAMADAPGSNPAWHNEEGLNCVDCHHQHGRSATGNTDPKGQWRILKGGPGNIGSANNAVLTYERGDEPEDMTKDIKWRATSPFFGGSYETDNTDFYEPTADASRYAAWCQGCHTNFHGNSADPDMYGAHGWIRHPAAEANIGAIPSGGYSSRTDFQSHYTRPQVMSPTGNWGPQGDSTWIAPTDLTPSCFSCHKGHGNDRPFGLIYMTGRLAGGPDRTENGDGEEAVVLCRICHSQGGY